MLYFSQATTEGIAVEMMQGCRGDDFDKTIFVSYCSIITRLHIANSVSQLGWPSLIFHFVLRWMWSGRGFRSRKKREWDDGACERKKWCRREGMRYILDAWLHINTT